MDFDTKITVPADEILIGDTFNTNCGVGGWEIVTHKSIQENDAPGQSDRVYVEWMAPEISPCRTMLAGSMVEILPTSPLRGKR
jgi:hypothetical protein